MWPEYPFVRDKPRQYQPYLQIWKAKGRQLIQIFKTPATAEAGPTEPEIHFKDDPVTKAARFHPQDADFNIDRYPKAETDGYLFVEAIVLQFTPDYSMPMTGVRDRARDRNFVFPINGAPCRILIISTDLEIDKPTRQHKQDFLLLARDRSGGWVYHHLVQLKVQGDVAVRVTKLSLLIPEDQLAVIQELEPRKRRLVLA